MKISIIAAIGRNGELGKKGQIPWHISEDFRRFKQITLGHPVVMGRKTWESLPIKPLPGRYNIVITRDSSYIMQNSENVKMVSSLKGALRLATLAQGNDECFIIGGGQIFNQSISLADKLYLTIIDASFDADTFFPDYSEFKKISEEDGQEGNYKYKFIELEK